MTGNDHEDWASHSSATDGRFADPPLGRAPRPVPGRRSLAVDSSLQSRWALAAAVIGSALLLGGTVLLWRHEGAGASDSSTLALPGPWEPPTVAADGASLPATVNPPWTSPAFSASATEKVADDSATPRTAKPSTTAPTSGSPIGPNLSISADADGSGKAEGTRFGNVRDGDLSTYWSPSGSTGEVSIKWNTPNTVSRIVIREASGGGTVKSWQVKNHDTGALLAAGTDARVIRFPSTTLSKITFVISTASSTPRIAEFETFAH